MEEANITNEECVYKEIIEGGKAVVIQAAFVEENMWELKIVGKRSQTTTWTDFFSTSEEAIEAGMTAILAEGIDAFYSNPEFSYLE